MKRSLLYLLLWCILILHLHASVKMVGSLEELKGLNINCHPNYSIIVEFPKEITILKVVHDKDDQKNWIVDYDLNLLWAQPDKLSSPDCSFKVSTDIYENIDLSLRVEKDPKNLIHTIVLKKEVFKLKEKQNDCIDSKIRTFKADRVLGNESDESELVKLSTIKQSELEEREQSKSTVDIENNIVDKDIKHKAHKLISPFDLETYFSLLGGTQNFEDSSFSMEGEFIVAGKNKKGFFFQGAGKVSINKISNQFGFSLGCGFEPGKLGLFMFADTLMQKTGEEFDSTTHFQIRPGIRYRLSNKFSFAGFFAFPIGPWKYTGVEVPSLSGFGFYNKALAHGGIDLSFGLDRLFVDMRTLIAEGSAFGIDFKAGYELIKKIFVTINYVYQSSGDHEYFNGISSTSRIGVGLNFNMRNLRQDDDKRLIFRPDYPMVVVAKKEIEESGSISPEISLAGTPTTGYAPLNVSYQATLKGFQGEVELTWFFNTVYSSASNNRDCAFIYTSPGTYECYVIGTDERGNIVTSNIVAITVLDVTTEDGEFTILSSVKEGVGSINPEGSTVVKFEEDQRYEINPGNGWYIKNVYVDGKSIGTVSEYVFKKIDRNHTIDAEFTDTQQITYTVTGSVRNNQYGTIDPVLTQVAEGSSVTLNFFPEDKNKQTIRYWINGQVYNDVGSGSVTINNITSNQNVEVEFDWIYYDVTITLTLLEGGSGSVDPGTGVFTYKSGENLTFNFNPETTF